MPLKPFESREAAPRPSKALPTVIVVDDDQTILAALRIVLSKKFKVETYTDPVLGARAASMPGVALAIIDMKMPEHDGFWVFRKIREVKPHLPVIFSSAHRTMEMPVELSTFEGPEAYLAKNGNLREFLRVVEDAVLKPAAPAR